MSDNLKSAKDEIELVRLMEQKLSYDVQDRNQMRDSLLLAIAHIETKLDKMDTVDDLRGVDTDE